MREQQEGDEFGKELGELKGGNDGYDALKLEMYLMARKELTVEKR